MKKLYQCEICNDIYATQEEAEKCEKQGIDAPIVNVGDVVKIKSGYGWFDGDVRWVINPNLEKDRNMGFYYVVTAINTRNHRCQYHVFTKAIKNYDNSLPYIGGTTYNTGHYLPHKINNPPEFILQDCKDLIGLKSKYLI